MRMASVREFLRWGMSPRALVRVGLILIMSLVFGGTVFGQGIVTGGIAGTVQDPQSAVVADAKVTAVGSATGATFTGKTNSEGYFELKGLPIGSYEVTIEASGFRKLRLASVIVEVGRINVLANQTLEVGSATEVVVVETTTPLMETTSSQIGANFSTKVVQSLPNAGGGFDNLALFIPGVANNGSTNFSNTNGAAIANNGLRGRSNNFQIDGQANNDNSVAGPLTFTTNPDVIAEVQVVSNNFSAEYGRNSGTVVNYLTKSGSNAFHGTAFEIYEGNWDRSLNNGLKNVLLGFCPAGVAAGTPTPYTSSCATPVIPRFVDNRWGGTFGGPILKNKLFFFFGYQGEHQRAQSSATSSSLTPTPAGLAALAAAFPGNSAVAALQSFGPFAITAGNPQVAGSIQNVEVSNGTGFFTTIPFSFVRRVVGNNFDDRQLLGRADWQITSKDYFFFRVLFQDSVTALGAGVISSGAFVAVPAEDRSYGWDYTRTWTPNFIQQFRVSYGKGFFQFAGGQGFPQCTIENVTACPPNISFSDATLSYTTFGLATNLPQDRQVKNTQVQNNSTWTRGRHTFKFGGEVDHQNSPAHFLPSVNGGFTFLSSPGSATDCQGTLPNGTVGSVRCSAFSNFIKGAGGCPSGATCSQLSLTDGPFEFAFKENDLAFYAQDDWRIRTDLTLNLGLRWEWYGQAINLLHDITVKNVADGFWAPGLSPDVTEIPKIPEDLNNFGPNVGFAWTPRILKSVFGEGKTVFRGGYRVAYDPAFYNIFLNVATVAPVVNAGTLFNVGVPADATGSGVQAAYLSSIPRGGNPGARSQTRVSPDFHNPYVQQWSFGLTREITRSIAFETRYVGNHGVGNFQTINGNPLIFRCTAFTGDTCTGTASGLAVTAPQYIPSGVTPCTPSGAAAGSGSTTSRGRPDCRFTLLRVRTNGAWSIYHGIQSELRIRSFHGFTANLAYTFSKALDNTSEIFASTGGNSTPISLNPFDPNRTERGVSAQSFPHVVTTYWIYELPWKRNQQGFLGKVIGGWQFAGTHRYQTGVAITPVQNTNNGDPYCDDAFNNNFIGSTLDSCRPLLSNPNAPFNSVGRYLNATTLINVSSCMSTSFPGTAACPTVNPSDVHFIVNNTFAINALCGGDPFACTVGRNVTRMQPRNQVDLSLQKTFRLTERVNFTLRGDVLNAFNYQFYGVPGLNTNNRNAAGVTCSPIPPGTTRTLANCLPGVPAPNTFGEVWANNGTFRNILVSGRISF
jgi:hypothetical protein